MDPHAVPGQPCQRPAGGVPIGVVGPDGDERHPRTGRGQEAGIGVRAPVVGHLEHVRPHVHPGGQDPLLGSGAQVASEKDADTLGRDPDEEAEVVGRGGGGGPPGCRRQDLHRRRAHGPPVARQQDRAFQPAATQQPIESGDPGVFPWERARRHLTHVPAAQRAGQSTGMVGIEVGEQHERQRVDPESAEAAVDAGDLASGVDENPGPRSGRHDQGVALADVARNDDGLRRGPAPEGLPHGPPQHGGAHHGGQRERAQSREPPQRPPDHNEENGQQHRTRSSRGPTGGCVRYGRRPLGHQHEPAHGPAGQPDQGVGERRKERGDQGGGEAEHRGGCHSGSCQQVRGQ
ncbi:MAG: hypothetical protein JWP40_2247 [Blastococcus sp.]|nr:hypothetical protein [Blastococcus sp.]